MFSHQRTTPVGRTEDIFLAVKTLTPLNAEDGAKDPYRHFTMGGCLYYDEYDIGLLVIRPDDVVCHFARTCMKGAGFKTTTRGADGTVQEVLKFAKPCVHVMKLNRVCNDVETTLVEVVTDESSGSSYGQMLYLTKAQMVTTSPVARL